MDIKKIQEEIEKYKAWIILAVVLLVITGFGKRIIYTKGFEKIVTMAGDIV